MNFRGFLVGPEMMISRRGFKVTSRAKCAPSASTGNFRFGNADVRSEGEDETKGRNQTRGRERGQKRGGNASGNEEKKRERHESIVVARRESSRSR